MSSSVIVNGHNISKGFDISRGCRQGDPISPYLFVLVVEVLAEMIRNNTNIKGITIDEVEFKLTQYADYTTLILDGSTGSLNNVMKTLDNFYNMCGLKINTLKTSTVWIGNFKNNIRPLCSHLNLDWKFNGQFDMLGVSFSTNLNDMLNLNYQKALSTIRQLIDTWSKRSLSVLGRIKVVKSLLLSKLYYFAQMLPNPSEDYMKTLNDIIFKFVWDGKPDKIKRSQIILDYEFGGVKLPHIKTQLDALKIGWLRKGNIRYSKMGNIILQS